MSRPPAFSTSFSPFAEAYDRSTGDSGDYSHQQTIDAPLFELAGPVAGSTAYDVACGNGYLARRLVGMGAREVWASDISPELIAIARTRYDLQAINYSVREASDFESIPAEHFDLVVMNMAIHLVGELALFVRGVCDVLKPGGRFVFSLDHPLRFVAYKDINAYDVDVVGESKRYLVEGQTTTFNQWTQKEDFNMYSRPLSAYVNACGKSGLFVDEMREPTTRTGTEDSPMESEVPFKMVVRAVKVK